MNFYFKLNKVFKEYASEKISLCAYYNDVFESYTPKSILEVGVFRGKSTIAWKTLFPDCDITSVDITDKYLDYDIIKATQANFIIGDATNPNTFQDIQSHDVIFDDASHYYKDIIRTFSLLKDKFNYAYIIEDVIWKEDLILYFIKRCGFTKVVQYRSTSTYPISHEHNSFMRSIRAALKVPDDYHTPLYYNFIVIYK